MSIDPSVNLDSNDVDTVIVASVDLQGRLFGKRMSTETFTRIKERGVYASSCALGWDFAQSTGLKVDYTGFHTGWHDLRLVPDLETFRRLPWLRRTAICLADVTNTNFNEYLRVAPRSVLKAQIQALAALGLEASIGLEIEFFLFGESYQSARSKGFKDITLSNSQRSQDLINRQTNSWEPFFCELRQNSIEAGLHVSFSQAEWGIGQWEVNLLNARPLLAADESVLLKLAVKDLAAAHGISATFMARPLADDVGSSCHINISLWDKSGKSIFCQDGQKYLMSESMHHVIGGILEHLPSCMPFYAPTVNAYKRTGSRLFAGNGHTWGYDNRTVSCRVVGNDAGSLRVEFRVPGADANPYLAIAAVLASAIDGIERKLDPGPAAVGNAFANRDPVPLPANLGEAAREFKQSSFAQAAFGTEVVAHFGAHAEYEWEEFMRAITDWEHRRYFEDA